MDKNLTITNQNSKLTLSKTRSLLDITNKLLSKKDIDTLIENFEFKHFLKYEGHSSYVNSVTISPDGKYIVSGSDDETIKIWDIKTGECLNTLEGQNRVKSVTISPDGKYIVSGSIDKTIKIWDIKTAECLNTLEGHSSYVESVTISPDGKYIVSGSSDKTIKIWDIKTGECLNTLEGHSYWVNSVTISPDGKYIVSGSRDKTIKIWDIRKGVCIYTLDYSYEISIDSNGYFKGSLENIEKYLRVSESPLTQRKLTSEEIKHFLKKDNFLDIGNV